MSSPTVWKTPTATLLLLVPLVCACRAGDRSGRGRPAPDLEPAATYQAEVEEGLGAAVAILVDTSGSMRETAPGDTRPKYIVAQDALESMLDATETFVSRRT